MVEGSARRSPATRAGGCQIRLAAREKDERIARLLHHPDEKFFCCPNDSRPGSNPSSGATASCASSTRRCCPREVRYVETRDSRDVADAIRRLAVRGAPLIGIAAAYGARAGARARAATCARGRRSSRHAPDGRQPPLGARPRAGGRSRSRRAKPRRAASTRSRSTPTSAWASSARRSSRDGATVLTHCNTGALATGGIGTALGVIKIAHRQGKARPRPRRRDAAAAAGRAPDGVGAGRARASRTRSSSIAPQPA